jgi:hypothetical protein
MEWSGGKGTQTRLATASTITTASRPPPEIGCNRHGGKATNQPKESWWFDFEWLSRETENRNQAMATTHRQRRTRERRRVRIGAASERGGEKWDLCITGCWWGDRSDVNFSRLSQFLLSPPELIRFHSSIYGLNGGNRGVTTTYHITCLVLERHFLFVACS